MSFTGFSSRSFTPIPDPFFSQVLPEIKDLAELKVTLYLFWLLYHKKGYPRFATLEELLSDRALVQALGEDGIRRGLEAAVGRGTSLKLVLEKDGNSYELYFLNNEEGRRAVARIEAGELELGGVVHREPLPQERPNIFTLYEQHIGLLTPLIAEDLKEAERLYPASWIEEAFQEAVRLNKPNWKYISRILERWRVQGKRHGRAGKDLKADLEPKEYLQRYGRKSGG